MKNQIKFLNLLIGKTYSYQLCDQNGEITSVKIVTKTLTQVKMKGTSFSEEEVAKILFNNSNFYQRYVTWKDCINSKGKTHKNTLQDFIDIQISGMTKSFLKPLRVNMYVFGDYEHLSPETVVINLLNHQM